MCYGDICDGESGPCGVSWDRCIRIGALVWLVLLLLGGIALFLWAVLDIADVSVSEPTAKSTYSQFAGVMVGAALMLVATVPLFILWQDGSFSQTFACKNGESQPYTERTMMTLLITTAFPCVKAKQGQPNTLALGEHKLIDCDRYCLLVLFCLILFQMTQVVVFQLEDQVSSSRCLPEYDCFLGHIGSGRYANCTEVPSVTAPQYFDCRRLLPFDLDRLSTATGTAYGYFKTVMFVTNALLDFSTTRKTKYFAYFLLAIAGVLLIVYAPVAVHTNLIDAPNVSHIALFTCSLTGLLPFSSVFFRAGKHSKP